MSNAVEPKVGMPVEHGLGTNVKPSQVQVINVFTKEQKHQLGYSDGSPYAAPAPNKELVRVGEKVIWNHD